jgi:hypothetical protein
MARREPPPPAAPACRPETLPDGHHRHRLEAPCERPISGLPKPRRVAQDAAAPRAPVLSPRRREARMPDGPLKSAKFKDNERLQKCAQLDPFHVMPGSPASDHVRLIQEALREVDGADIPASETNYGQKTVEAVIAFKTKHNIFTRGTRQVDPITGIGTIGKLDELLRKKPTPPVPPPPPPPGPIEREPTLALSGECQLVAEQMDNPAAADLAFADPIASIRSQRTAQLITPFSVMSDASLEATMLGVMGAAVMAAGKGEGVLVKASAMDLCLHFFSGGRGRARSFGKDSAIGKAAKGDDGGLNFTGKIAFEIDRAVRAAWKAGHVDDRLIAQAIKSQRFEVEKFSGALTACIGGFQGFRVRMCDFKADVKAKTFSYRLDCEVFDHFGVDDTDIARGGSGSDAVIGGAMGPFFVLQHQRSALPDNRLAGKYRPFRVTIAFDREHDAKAF